MEEVNKKKSIFKKVIAVFLIIVIAGAGYGCYWYIDSTRYVSTDDADVSGDMINATPKAAGKVLSVNVKEGDVVHKGEVLFTLESDGMQLQLNQAQAALSLAEDQLAKLVGGARAQDIEGAQSLCDQSEAGYDAAAASRNAVASSLSDAQSQYNSLLDQLKPYKTINGSYDMSGAVKILDAQVGKTLTDAQYTAKLNAIEGLFTSKAQMEAQIKQLKGQLGTLNSQVMGAKAALDGAKSKLSLVKAGASDKDVSIAQDQLKSAQAAYDLAKLNLGNAQVTAPIDGTVIQVNVHVGDLASPGTSTISLTDMSKLEITANMLETDIEKVKAGQDVKITIDAFPKDKFTGKVSEVGLATASTFSLFGSDNVTGSFSKTSQRIPVKIQINSQDKTIVPGMSAEVKIKVK